MRGPSPKNGSQKHAKFASILYNFRFDRESPERIDMSKIGKAVDQLYNSPKPIFYVYGCLIKIYGCF